MTVINSNVGSTPTLTATSINVTVNNNASITVRATSVTLLGDHIASVTRLVTLSHTAVHGVRRGIVFTLNLGNIFLVAAMFNVAKL